MVQPGAQRGVTRRQRRDRRPKPPRVARGKGHRVGHLVAVSLTDPVDDGEQSFLLVRQRMVAVPDTGDQRRAVVRGGDEFRQGCVSIGESRVVIQPSRLDQHTYVLVQV